MLQHTRIVWWVLVIRIALVLRKEICTDSQLGKRPWNEILWNPFDRVLVTRRLTGSAQIPMLRWAAL